MIYAEDRVRNMLVEFKSEKALNIGNEMVNDRDREYLRYKPLHRTSAHQWVKKGYPHDTGLWLDYDGKMKYAKADSEGY